MNSILEKNIKTVFNLSYNIINAAQRMIEELDSYDEPWEESTKIIKELGLNKEWYFKTFQGLVDRHWDNVYKWEDDYEFVESYGTTETSIYFNPKQSYLKDSSEELMNFFKTFEDTDETEGTNIIFYFRSDSNTKFSNDEDDEGEIEYDEWVNFSLQDEDIEFYKMDKKELTVQELQDLISEGFMN